MTIPGPGWSLSILQAAFPGGRLPGWLPRSPLVVAPPTPRSTARVTQAAISAPHVAAALAHLAHHRPPPSATPSRPPAPTPANGRGALWIQPRRLTLDVGSPGQTLDPDLHNGLEDFFGQALASVRLHHRPTIQALGARALTRGDGIYLADPRSGTSHDPQLLAHEVAHVLQQRDGRAAARLASAIQRTPAAPGALALVHDPGLEAEAERLAHAFGRRWRSRQVAVPAAPTTPRSALPHSAPTGSGPRVAPPSGRPAAPVTQPSRGHFQGHRPPPHPPRGVPTGLPGIGVIQAMNYRDLVVGKRYRVDGGTHKLTSKGHGWLHFSGLLRAYRASQVIGEAKSNLSTKNKKKTTGKITLYSDYPFHNDEYSDSDDDLEDSYEELLNVEYRHPKRKKGQYHTNQVKLLNWTKWHHLKSIREMGIDNTVRRKKDWPRLEADARAIHGAANLSRPQAYTVVCVVARTKAGAAKKFAFTNLEYSMYPDSRNKAHTLGYHVIATNQSHAELEALVYLRSRGYELLDMGCDKKHCAECKQALHKTTKKTTTNKKRKYPSQTDESNKVFTNYYVPPLAQEVLGLAPRDRLKKKKKLYSNRYRPKDDSGFDPLASYSRTVDFSELHFTTGARPNRTYKKRKLR